MDSKWDAATVGEVLRGAAELVEEKGWAQKTNQTPDGRVCLGYAIELSAKALFVAKPELRHVPGNGCTRCDPPCSWGYAYLSNDACRVFGKFLRVGSAVMWNDRAERTADEVITGMRACADQIDPPK
jgi:hypothetical protein